MAIIRVDRSRWEGTLELVSSVSWIEVEDTDAEILAALREDPARLSVTWLCRGLIARGRRIRPAPDASVAGWEITEGAMSPGLMSIHRMELSTE